MAASDRYDGDTIVGFRLELAEDASAEAGAEGAFLELAAIRERGGPSLFAGPWKALEIWTQNRVYGVDATMRCIEVFDRASGKVLADHAILGASLLGGQRRGKDGAIRSVSVPYPEPGTVAVFSTRVGGRVKVSETSTVTRVVIRQHRVDLPGASEAPWDALARAYVR